MKIIQEFNEFTWDMVRALPKAYYFYKNGIPYRVECKPNLKNLYYFSNNVSEINRFDEINPKETYNHNRPSFTLREWMPPPLKERYNKLTFSKPTVIIQNKYTLEWGAGVFNYFPIDVLDSVIKQFKNQYQIIYIRPMANVKGYYQDENLIKPFNDYEFIESNYPDVITIFDIMKKYNMDYNEAQFNAHSTSNIHITTSGGSACISSYFDGIIHIYDSPNGAGAGRGIWKSDSWLKDINGSEIVGYNNYESIINNLNKR